MGKFIEKIIYSFGINITGDNPIIDVNLLEKFIPEDYKRRKVVDIGCGDGRISLKLKHILESKSYIGIDINKSLIKSAKRRGLHAKLIDVENQTCSGDLGILWGSLHHFKNPASTLGVINKNFNSLIIRESINDKRILELGHQFNRKTLMKILMESDIKIKKIIEGKKNKSLIILT